MITKKLLIAAVLGGIMPLQMIARNKAESDRALLAPGDTMVLSENFVRTDIVLKAELSTPSFEKISVGLGPECYRGGGIDITKDTYIFFDRRKWRKGKGCESADSVTMFKTRWSKDTFTGNRLSITIATHHGYADLTIKSAVGTYRDVILGWWQGGTPFIINQGPAPVKVALSFEILKSDEPVWFYGDSYFSTLDKARWPYYMYHDGYHNWMADHIPGGNSRGMLQCFKNDLKFGTPKVAVWMLGMNDGSDKDGKPCPGWLKCINEFLSICKEKGIEPVLTTIPTVPKRFHDCKTEWVRGSGYRYIDWYKACGADSEGKWNDGYLNSDDVHPDAAGAQAFWTAVKEALPELTR